MTVHAARLRVRSVGVSSRRTASDTIEETLNSIYHVGFWFSVKLHQLAWLDLTYCIVHSVELRCPDQGRSDKILGL